MKAGAAPVGPGRAEMTVAQALAEAQRASVDRLDAQLMLAHLLQHPRSWLIAHDDEPLGAQHSSRYLQWLERRGAGEPLAYLLGQAEFCGLTLQVGPEVLIPRPETELLVDWGVEVLATWAGPATPARVIDLGCGSGAIALAIRHRHPAAAVTAVDASAPALDIARRNAEALGLPITWALGDWWSAVAGQRFHLALANPPYVAPGDPHLQALRHEPQSALVAPDNGMADLRRLIDMAPESLHPGGWLLLEHGHDQGLPVRERLQQVGFSQVETRCDLAGLERCTGGRFG